jgi:hypothetical protein
MKNLLLILVAIVCGTSGVFGAAPAKLTKAQAEAAADELWREKQAAIAAQYGPMWDSTIFRHNDLAMPIAYRVFGEKPEDGRSLWISMHGGGNAPAELNTRPWMNQIMLYTPAEGVYVAPRAAVDDWNMWFRPHIDTLFSMIIQAAVVKMDVNPNKVYIMGYSAGGDGVYRLAPRMADHWAAAAMMAGHPGEASPLNLRNIGFTLWMGELDAAYDRNRLAVEYGGRMDSLHAADPLGYIHQTHIVEGAPHWMNRADTLAVGWMSRFTRNPYPDRVVWRQEETNPRAGFYYLSVPPHDAKAAMEVRVEMHGNEIEIVRNDYATLYIDLNDRMMDLDKPVTVTRNGKRIFRGRVVRREEHIRRSIAERADPAYIFSARIEVSADGAKAL